MRARRHWVGIGVAVLSILGPIAVVSGERGDSPRARKPATGLVHEVRRATERFHDASAATAAGYAAFLGCVSGPERGAMGVHFVNDALVSDGVLDPLRPEALIYEPRDGRLRLVGVEYVVIAEAWDAKNQTPPTLVGQLFHHTGSPNRYGIPAFYSLHVWAWRENANGVFADWNPKVSCEEYTAQAVTQPSPTVGPHR
jgi:hypothetical protein